MGNDVAITVEMQGHYELNVFKPVMAANFLQSARLLGDACTSLTNIAGIEPNYKRITELVDNSLIVTALNTKIGYYKSAEIAQAHKKWNNFKRKRFV
jgi:fumarate hydratase class II